MLWENISEDMWLNISSQIDASSEWQICKTTAYNNLMFYMNDAKTESSVMWVVGPAGIGKSTAATSFAAQNQNVFRFSFLSSLSISSFTSLSTWGAGPMKCLFGILMLLPVFFSAILCQNEASVLISFPLTPPPAS